MASATATTVTVSFDPTAINTQSDILFGATPTKAGVMTAAQAAALAPAITETDVIINVVPGGPVSTLAQAAALVPFAWRKQCKIFLAPGVAYTTDGIPRTSGIFTGIPVGPEATPLAIIGGYTDEIGTQTETVGDPTGVTVSTGTAMALDEFRGGFIRCLTGANAGQRRSIASNTVGGAVSVRAPAFTAPIAIGDTFVIEQPSVAISYSELFGFQGPETIVGLKGIRWIAAGPNAFFNVDGAHLYQEGVQYYAGFTTMRVANQGQFHGGSGEPDYVGGPWVADGVDNPFPAETAPAGVYFNLLFLFVINGQMNAYLTSDFVFQLIAVALVNFSGLDGRFHTLFTVWATALQIRDFSATAGTPPNAIESILGLDAVNIRIGSPIVVGPNPFGAAVSIDANSELTALAPITGTGSTGAGISVSGGSNAIIATGTTVTGALGDMIMEGTPFGNHSYADPDFTVGDVNGIKGFADQYRNRIKVQ
jgi:hypothetical protein